MSEELAGDELRDEYQFDYSQAKPNRFATLVERKDVPPGIVEHPLRSGDERPPGELSMESNLSQLRKAATTFARCRELAEAKAVHINPTIDQLVRSKLVTADHAIIGEVIHSVGYGESETARYFAAGIQGEGGIGAFEYTLDFGEQPDEFTTYQFVPFAACPPVVQARLAGQIDELMSRLMWELRVQA